MRDGIRFQLSKPPPKTTTKLYIKYMVSIRCKLIVKDLLQKLGILYSSVNLGEAIIEGELSAAQRDMLNTGLKRWGLELLEDKKAILVERIKDVIIETVHYSDEALKIHWSDHLSERLQHDYTYLANVFSATTGTTIAHFIIMHKIERAKELLIYDELTLSEIAYRLHYSSVAHLSNQFKKVSGLTPTFFMHLKKRRLTALENV
jgi:AraC-like DNA-binding protein